MRSSSTIKTLSTCSPAACGPVDMRSSDRRACEENPILPNEQSTSRSSKGRQTTTFEFGGRARETVASWNAMERGANGSASVVHVLAGLAVERAILTGQAKLMRNPRGSCARLRLLFEEQRTTTRDIPHQELLLAIAQPAPHRAEHVGIV